MSGRFSEPGHALPESRGVQAIDAERLRQQVIEGHTQEGDLSWWHTELVGAAIFYALHASGQKIPPGLWPWPDRPFKPADHGPAKQAPNLLGRVKDLRRAGALIAAEIDRLLNSWEQE